MLVRILHINVEYTIYNVCRILLCPYLCDLKNRQIFNMLHVTCCKTKPTPDIFTKAYTQTHTAIVRTEWLEQHNICGVVLARRCPFHMRYLHAHMKSDAMSCCHLCAVCVFAVMLTACMCVLRHSFFEYMYMHGFVLTLCTECKYFHILARLEI